MPKLISLCTLFLISVSLSTAQWDQSPVNERPSPLQIACSATGQRILASFRSAGFWLTDDGGDSWTPINERIVDAKYINGVNIEAVGASADTFSINAVIFEPFTVPASFHSHDGGETWLQYDFTNFWPDSVSIIGDPAITYSPHLNNYLYLVCHSGFMYSSTSGQTWNFYNINPITMGVEGIIVDPNIVGRLYIYGAWGYESGGNNDPTGGIIMSEDHGITWQRVSPMEDLAGGEGGIMDLQIAENGDIYALTYWTSGSTQHPAIIKSTDYGYTWNWLSTPTGIPVYASTISLTLVPEVPGRFFLVTDRKVGVFKSDDYGVTWQRLLNGLPEHSSYVNDVYRNPYSGDLYALVDGYGIYRSQDYGESWNEVSGPPLHSESSEWWHGLNVQEGGMLQTDIAGNLWYAEGNSVTFSQIDLPADSSTWIQAFPVVFNDDLQMFSCVRRGFFEAIEELSLIYSVDDGMTWSTSPSYTYPISAPRSFFVTENDPLTIVGADLFDTRVFLSSDTGATWQIDEHGEELTRYGYNDGNLYATNYLTGDILKYPVNTNEDPEYLGFPDPQSLSFFLNFPLFLNDTLFIPVWNQVWSYTDQQVGGWTPRGTIEDIVSIRPMSVEFVTGPSDTFMVAGHELVSHLYWSYDNGWTWERQDTDLPWANQGTTAKEITYDQYRDRLWVDTGAGLAYLDDPTSAVGEDVWVFKPANYLTVNAYPNPFNSSTTITYSLAAREQVTVNIYDLLGRKVETLVEGWKQPGSHNAIFDARGLATGTYYLRVVAGDQTSDRKLVLVK